MFCMISDEIELFTDLKQQVCVLFSPIRARDFKLKAESEGGINEPNSCQYDCIVVHDNTIYGSPHFTEFCVCR